jgi:aromatase
VHAEREVLFRLAAAVEDWPRILPHYRRVAVLEGNERSRIVDMAARRDVVGGLAFPLRWQARQTVSPEQWIIDFDHIAGPTPGMHVEWRFDVVDARSVDVTIRHHFAPRWPVPGKLVDLIVGEYFVNGVARRTLRHIAYLAAQGL